MGEEQKQSEELCSLAKAALQMRVQRIRMRMEIEALSGISAEDRAAFLATCQKYERKARAFSFYVDYTNILLKGGNYTFWSDWKDWSDWSDWSDIPSSYGTSNRRPNFF